jgi:hypothetical protein
VTGAAELLVTLGHEVTQLSKAPFDDAALAKDFLTTWFVECAYEVDEAKAASGANDSEFESDTRLIAALGRATKPPYPRVVRTPRDPAVFRPVPDGYTSATRSPR